MNTPSSSNPPLLDYSFSTRPDPLIVGGPADLVFVVSNPLNEVVVCSRIALDLPVGAGSSDLIANSASIETRVPEGWTCQAAGGMISFSPAGGSATLAAEGLVFALAVTVNGQPGTATAAIVETASTSDQPPQSGQAEFAWGKFPAASL